MKALLFFFVILVSSSTLASSEANNAISLIERICGKEANKGELLDIKLVGTGSAKTMKLISVLAGGEVTGEVVINKQSAEGLITEIERAKNIESNRTCKMRYFDQIAPKIFDLILEQAEKSKDCKSVTEKIRSLKSRQQTLLDNMVYATERQKKNFQDEYAKNREIIANLEGRDCT